MKRNHGLEAFTVCMGHGDFLHETAKWNTPHFDDWFIATSADDFETREVCRKFNLKCLVTQDHAKDGTFNKGRVIDRLLHLSSSNCNRLHVDADIAVPHGFRHLIQAASLRNDFIYGADRVDVFGWAEWQKLQNSGFMNHSLDYGCRVNIPQGFSIGTRWAHPVHGYVPVGYFQLWHSSEDEFRGVRVKNYPHKHGSACRTDVQFPMLWDREQRGLIPELVVAHLMSERAPKGVNWTGNRQTKRFGPNWTNSCPTNIGS